MTSGSKKAALAIGALVLLIGAFFIGRVTSPVSKAPSGTDRSAPTDAKESNDEKGAVLAATAFASTVAEVSVGEQQYIELVTDMATPEWKEQAEELARNALTFVADRYGQGGSLSFAPVRYRVAAYTDSAATIDIWGAVLAAGKSGESIEESWSTSTIDLVWTADRWLVADQWSEAGPTPQLVQAGEVLPPSSLDSFEDYTGAPNP